MIDMAKRASERKPKQPERSGVNINIWVDERLAAALARYLRESKPAPSKTAAMEAALEMFLESVGYWPPAGEK